MNKNNWQKIGLYRCENGKLCVVSMRAQLTKLKDNEKPYFSIIGIVERATRRGTIDKRYKNPVCFGACYDILQRVKPSLTDLISMRLSDIDGTPLHDLENGYYYCEHPEDFDDDVIAKHFRVPLADVPALRKMTKAALSTWIETQRPRWKAEADAVIEKYKLQIVHE